MVWFTDSLPRILVEKLLDPNGNEIDMVGLPDGSVRWAFFFEKTGETKYQTATSVDAAGALFEWTDRTFFGDPEVGDVYNGIYIHSTEAPAGTQDMIKDEAVKGFKRP